MTNKDLIKQYVNTGFFIGHYQFNKLSPPDRKTYLRARLLAYKQSILNYLTTTELKYLSEEQKVTYYNLKIGRGALQIEPENFKYLSLQNMKKFIWGVGFDNDELQELKNNYFDDFIKYLKIVKSNENYQENQLLLDYIYEYKDEIYSLKLK